MRLLAGWGDRSIFHGGQHVYVHFQNREPRLHAAATSTNNSYSTSSTVLQNNASDNFTPLRSSIWKRLTVGRIVLYKVKITSSEYRINRLVGKFDSYSFDCFLTFVIELCWPSFGQVIASRWHSAAVVYLTQYVHATTWRYESLVSLIAHEDKHFHFMRDVRWLDWTEII